MIKFLKNDSIYLIHSSKKENMNKSKIKLREWNKEVKIYFSQFKNINNVITDILLLLL